MILDPCCGTRMMWFDRLNPAVTFGDNRRETITVTDNSKGNKSGTRTLQINPDVDMDFRQLPYADCSFKLVAFDPPHLVYAGPRSWLAAKYGKLSGDWREDLRLGFAECFRVLDVCGVLVFKWNETQVKLKDVLPLTPEKPLFGQVSGRKGMTHWLVFMKQAIQKECAACGGSGIVHTGIDEMPTEGCRRCAGTGKSKPFPLTCGGCAGETDTHALHCPLGSALQREVKP